MGNHLSKTDIELYLKRKLKPNDLLAADDHLAGCDACLKMITENEQTAACYSPEYLSPDAEETHLTYEQMADFVDDEVDAIEREIVEVHMEICRQCADQLEALFQVKETLEVERQTVADSATPGKFGIGRFWGWLHMQSPMKLAIPAAALVFVGLLIWMVWQPIVRPNPDIVKGNETNSISDTAEVNNSERSNDSKDINAEITNSNNPIVPKTILALNDGGGRIELDENGKLTGIEAPAYVDKILAALTTQTIDIAPENRRLKSVVGVLMGDSGSVPFALMEPVGKIIETERPVFRWRPFKDAESYLVNVYDGNFNKIASSPPIQKTAWQIDVPLKRGGVYHWQATAVTIDGEEIKSPVRPAPDAKFKVLDSAKAGELRQAKKRHGNSHLLLGILYANAGLIDDAEREFQALVRKNPESAVARKLMMKIRDDK